MQVKWENALGVGQFEQRRTEMSVFLVIGRAAQSLGSVRSTSDAGEEPTGRAQHVTLISRQHWSQSLGVAGGHTRYVGSTKGQVVTVGRWFELDMERQTGPAAGAGWMLGGPELVGGLKSKAEGEGGLWAGETQRVGTCKATEPQRWTFVFSLSF